MVALEITTNILIYNNLVWINTNLIIIAYKNFTPIKLHPPSLLCCYCHINHISYIVCPTTQVYNYCFVQLSLKCDGRKHYKQKIHLYCHLYFPRMTFTSALYFFMWIWVIIKCSFILAWRITFNVSGRTDLLVTNTLSFYLSGNVLNVSLF